MATVYLAEDLKHHRPVALKVLKPELAAVLGADRFLKEITVTANLQHPHILPLYDSGSAAGLVYYVMPHVEGGSLREQLVREHELPIDEAIRIAKEVASGLEYAHGRGILHRDIKPENVLLQDGQVLVADFGIAIAVHHAGGSRLTESGLSLGTPQYMSLEQAMGERELDARSDLYSLACVLYEMLAGEPPFPGPSAEAILARKALDPVRPLRTVRSQVPQVLEQAILRALSKAPADRFPTVAAFASALTESADDPAAARKSVAVLPFVNMSPDPENEYFSDGVTEDIIAQLAKVGDLRVISRTSIMRYKHTTKSLREIGEELGVATLLEGSVRRTGDRVRIVAQLLDALTDAHLWADTYDREISDIFSIQSDVALRIADALKATLSPGEQSRIQNRPKVSAEAYNAYLLGCHHWNKRTELGFQRAIEHFHEAIETDPGYALAYAGLADCYILLPFYGDRLPGEAYPKAQVAALRALALDDSLAEAHASLAAVKASYEFDWTEARTAFEAAVGLSPGYAWAHLMYAWFLMAQGDCSAAVEEARSASELDPLSLIALTDMGDLLYYARRNDEAIAQHLRALQVDDRFWITHENLARAYVQAGRFSEALDALERAKELSQDHPSCAAFAGYTYACMGAKSKALEVLASLVELAKGRSVPSYLIAMIHAALGDRDEAFAWLTRAVERRDSAWLVYYVAADPWADALREDPRFHELLAAFKLEPRDGGSPAR
jgi:serine/threonine protein kinase/Tfp pilus assembly protein PilF